MTAFQNKNSMTTFRHRGVQCSNCQETIMLFGNDSAPAICPNCKQQDTIGKMLWDHMVTTKTSVEDLLAQGAATQGTVAP